MPMLTNWIKSRLTLPEARRVDIDAPETTMLRSRIIQSKPFLSKLYAEWYAAIVDSLPRHIHGPVVEIGSGGGFLKDIIPDLIASEVLQVPGVDIICNGHFLPFRKNSLRGIVMLDVFHHFSRAGQFLSAATDCVIAGGVVVMIEPWNSCWSRFVYNYLHHEPFEAGVENWDFPDSGPLSGANSALPWIVFERDRNKFEQRFPQWKIDEIALHTPFRYLLSGGVSFRSMMPEIAFNLWRRIETGLNPWMTKLAMFARIVLIRR
jgi:hypothetical protein